MKQIALITIFAATLLLLPLGAQATPGATPLEFVTVYNESDIEFNPHLSIFSNEAQIFTAVYEGLFSFDPATLEPVLALAESWTKTKDGLSYTFTIRKNARWSDGSSIQAHDFSQSWFRLLDLNAQYAAFFDIIKGASDYRLKKSLDRSKVGIEALDDTRLRVTLNRPVAYFTRLLCHHSFSPIHQSMRDKAGWQTLIPFPVSGPYSFKSFEKGRLSLEKNLQYWDAESVSVPNLTFVFTDDDDSASRMFNNDEAHWLAGPGNYDTILLQEAIQVFPIFSTHYWYFDCSEAPWNDGRIRRALALLLPWNELRDSDRYMIPATTLVLPLPGYSAARGIENQDKNAALGLLDASGYPLGKGLPEITIYIADTRDARRVANLLKSTWESALEITVNILAFPPSQYYGIIGKDSRPSSLVMAHTTWIGDFADPEAFLQMWAPDSPLNEAGFFDLEFSKLLEESYSKEGRERFRLLAEAETVLLSKAAVLPIYHSFAASVIDIDYIDGWYQNALDIHPYKYLKFGTASIMPNVAMVFTATSGTL
jgi:peptide/nickel transport system substrate-binding protein/oligopeptide transport system substrate-binding protein